MYLEKLEIQGFKSFANKNKLIFPGIISGTKRGLTAIVGPNGSGKSNVADAVRWVLGEQSLKTLRGKKSEDVIFSGSDKKHQLSLAEVSLFLNNEDKSFKFRLDNQDEKENAEKENYVNLPEIVITRRLYRNGESEYLINNNRVRLLDIQMLLAKANFGQKTYSVIGQGMVENFLNTSAAERKDFFDEATGVKQFQIKRDQSLNKLEASYDNLRQTEMLLNEIQPRLKSLTRQVEKLKKRGDLESQLKANQLNYYHFLWSQINEKLNRANEGVLTLEKSERGQNEKVSKLLRELDKIRNADNQKELNELRSVLSGQQLKRDQLLKKMARLQAEIELVLESQGKFDLAWLNRKQEEIGNEIRQSQQELNKLETEKQKNINESEKEYQAINQKINNLNQNLVTLKKELNKNNEPEDQEKLASQIIKEILRELKDLKNLEDVNELKKALDNLHLNYEKKIASLNQEGAKSLLDDISRIQEEIISLSEQKQIIAEKINEQRLTNYRLGEQKESLKKKITQLNTELSELQNKAAKSESQPSTDSVNLEKKKLSESLSLLDEKIALTENKIKEINDSQEEEKKVMFKLQTDLQKLQAELADIQKDLGNLKIEATRQETKLEDLENNIRNESLEISIVKKHTLNNQDINTESLQKKINDLKHQLEQIGGIDPEAEKEYLETKERFDFLSSQTEDLRQAINSLEKIIYELDQNIKERFDKEFKIIEEKFNEYFKILFNGGQAKISKLSLNDQAKEDNEENGSTNIDEKLNTIKTLKKYNATGLAGIDIQATPPGKKIQSVAMLSGGERALTAIALICAIISANPAPFVVLDEVDAALDEANSERLAQILDDLSNRSQFILITHNRASMKKASVLYGITMHEGVSQLMSLKLEDAKLKS